MRRQLTGWAIDIIATDINAEVIERAKEGLYGDFEVLRGRPAPLLARHLRREGDNWRLAVAIRRAVQFRVFNLPESFVGCGPLDIIFCRNVLIYFDSIAKDDVVRRFSACLTGDGYLVLVSAEIMLGFPGVLEPLPRARGIYRKGQTANSGLLAALAG